MTHKDIYTKFMIEYDKANVTSSYPSLTEYEVATLLDKAYLALIAQKVTGNNPRRSPFEADVKSVADVQPLVTHKELVTFNNGHEPATNITQFKLPIDYLYSVQTMLNYNINHKKPGIGEENHLPEDAVYSPEDNEFENIDPNQWVQWYETYGEDSSKEYVEYENVYGETSNIKELKASQEDSTNGGPMHIAGNPYDKHKLRYLPCKLVPHETAERFFCTPYNMPWVKIPVCFIEENIVYIVYDPVNIPNVDSAGVHFTYIRKPNSFVENLNIADSGNSQETDNPSTEEHVPETIVYSPSDSGFENIDPNDPWLQWYEVHAEDNSTDYLEQVNLYGE